MKLGELRQDVLFNKGAPPIQKPWEKYQAQAKPRDLFEEYGIAADSKIKKNKTDNNSFSDVLEGFEVVSTPQENNKNADILHYGNLQIFFENDKVSYVRKTCVDSLDSSSANGIACGNSLKDIESKLGKTEFVECSKDFLTRIYSFPKYQSTYLLTQNSVIDIAIYDSSNGKRLTDRSSFSECSPKN